ncbi:site-specific integrase [Belliella sp. R4-6]|uniref:Site-specific integrase n=1 Tax=Belliella alkalica TaxID=1730871 RepID=A0ABS9VGX5_9BACT|nr:site-specific integrase [Belliella alkalica]MCH7415697.1 site-specific integrase [Belliella alkalica]
MLEKSFGIMFFLKPTKNKKVNERYIYARVTVDGSSKELSTKRLWTQEGWDPSRGRAIGNREEVKQLNGFLDTFQIKIYEAKKILMDNYKDVTAESIKNYLVGKSDDRRFILEIFQKHNDKVEALVGTDFASGTLQRYKTSLDHTRSFIQWKFKKDDLEIKALNYEFISDYEFWFKTVRKCSHNTTMKYLANFKKIVLSCVKKDWLQKDPFMGYQLIKKDVVRSILSKEELQIINNKDLSMERLKIVRDVFLFCCYTGLAYIDVKNLRKSHIQIGIDGEQWIFTQRQKTETPTRLPLLPQALAIVNKYESHPQCISKDCLLPVLSNQKMNSYLKEIADVCGIDKPLTFHIARHTFATTITLGNGVPIETVSKMLGHKSLKQTQHYAKILDTKISSDMKKLRGILEE